MKLLVITLPLPGHTAPTATLVRMLIARDHQVRWMTGESARTTVEESGARFVPLVALPATDPAPLLQWALRCERLREAQAAEIRAAYEADDAIIADPTITGAETVWLDDDVPYAVLGILPLVHARPDWPLILQATIPALEYLHPELPNFACIGPLLPEQPPMALPPLDDRPLIFITQGTLATQVYDVIIPALKACADLPVQVVCAYDPRKLATDYVPANATLVPFVPYEQIMPKVAVFITNGGYVGVQTAVMCGVPMLVAGETEEKGVTAARVAYAGNGIDLGTGTPTAKQIQAGIIALANTPRFRERAWELAQRAAQTDAALTASLLLEHHVPRWRAQRAA